MRLVLTAESMIWIRQAQRVIFGIAILLLSYSGFVLADARVFQSRANVRLGQMLRDDAGTQSPQPEVAEAIFPEAAPATVEGGLIGRLAISRLGISVMVMEGDSEIMLRRAAGHIVGTAAPGQPGNVGIAAHRD